MALVVMVRRGERGKDRRSRGRENGRGIKRGESEDGTNLDRIERRFYYSRSI